MSSEMRRSLNETDLEIILDEKRTILYKITDGRYTYAFGTNSFLRNNTKRYIFYVVTLLILQGILLFATTVASEIIFSCLELIVFVVSLLECNFVIFKQSLKTFSIYYKTINILIALIAYNIDYDYFKDRYSDNPSLSLIKIAAIVSISKTLLLIFIVSVLDGYCIHKLVRIAAIVISVVYLVYYYYFLVYIQFESFQAIGYIFGHEFHWHTLATTCMASALIFLLTQCWNIIRKPSKLSIIPTLILFKTRHYNFNAVGSDLDETESESNEIEVVSNRVETDLDSSARVSDIFIDWGNIDSIYQIYINPKQTIYNYVCRCSKTQKSMQSCLFSTQTFFICAVYAISYVIFTVAIDFEIDGNIFLFLMFCLEISILLPALSLNVQIFKFAASKFVFWWKTLDAFIFYIAYQIIEYTSHSYEWSMKYTSSKAQCWIIAIVGFITIMSAVMAISSAQAFIYSLRFKMLVSNLLILSAIIYFLYHSVTYFVSNDDYIINVNLFNINKNDKFVIGLSCRTLVVDKSIDCSIFFLSQLYTNVRIGFKGIQVTGFVERRWNRIKPYRFSSNVKTFQSVDSVELINAA